MNRIFAMTLVGVAAASLAYGQAVSPATPPRAGQNQGVQTQPGVGGQTQNYSRTDQSGAGQSNTLDQHIATCLILANKEEIALAQFAQERAQHEEVKKFAQQMIEQHKQAVTKLEQAAPEVASMRGQLELNAGQGGQGQDRRSGDQASTGQQGQQGQPGQPRAATQAGGATGQPGGVVQASGASPFNPGGAQSGSQQGGQHQMVALAKEVKQQCLQLTQRELSEHEGADFDKAYIGQQVGAHIAMLAQLQASSQYASGNLRQVIQEGEQMTQEHMEHAKRIMDQIKDKGSNNQQ